MYVSKAPYLHDQADTDVVIQSIKNLKQAIAKVPEIVWEVPPANVTVEDYVKSVSYHCRLHLDRLENTNMIVVASDSCRSPIKSLDWHR